jgi:hypothetical protein
MIISIIGVFCIELFKKNIIEKNYIILYYIMSVHTEITQITSKIGDYEIKLNNIINDRPIDFGFLPTPPPPGTPRTTPPRTTPTRTSPPVASGWATATKYSLGAAGALATGALLYGTATGKVPIPKIPTLSGGSNTPIDKLNMIFDCHSLKIKDIHDNL